MGNKAQWPRWIIVLPLLVALSVVYAACAAGDGTDAAQQQDTSVTTDTSGDAVVNPDTGLDVNSTDAPESGG